MGLGFRLIFFEDDGTLRRISYARYLRLHRGEQSASFPEYAGKRVKAAQTVVRNEGRHVVDVLHVDWVIIPFDCRGRLDADEIDRLERLVVGTMGDQLVRNNVVDIAPHLAKPHLHRDFKWTPASNDVDRLYRYLLRRA